MSNTVLLPQSVSLYQTPNLEPQYVTTQVPNKAIIYLDSQDVVLETNKVAILMSTIKQFGENPSPLAFGISRISLDSIGINYITPNINKRNNTITFFSSATGVFHTVVIPEGFYTNPTNIMNAIVTALNMATGSSGLTFSSATITGFPSTFKLNSAGGNYYFLLICSAIVKGYQLYALPTDQTPTNSKTVGNIDGWYTRYIDVCSNTLSQFLKVKNTTTGKANNIITRVFVRDYSQPIVLSVQRDGVSIFSYNFPSNLPLLTIDFELRDQFGDLLYVPAGAEGTAGGFWWDTALEITI